MEGVEPPINPVKLISCRNCGHLNKRSARTCEKCGARFGWAEVAEAYARPFASRLGLVVLLIIPVVVILLAAVSIIAGHFGYGSVSRSVGNIAALIVGIFGLLILGLGILMIMYKRKPRQ
jgi:hypothetical protein